VSEHDDPRPLMAGVEAVVRSLQGGDAGTVHGIFGRWPEAVGAAIAAHVRPVKLDGDVLFVEVDEPGWATQIRFLEHELVERLRTVTEANVSRLEVRVARGQGARERRSGGRRT
jgi:predicted nucleic acid-binding Zn ribbon protein